MIKYKKAFSLIELIFIIAVLAIISSIAIPKFMDINEKANVASIKQDISTVVSSVQSYYIVNNKIDKISDSVNLNSSVWTITDKEIKYDTCISLKLNDDNLALTISADVSNICTELSNQGIKDETYSFK